MESKHYGSFVKAVMAFFGISTSEAVSEFKKLNNQDKVELAAGLTDLGYTWDGASPAAA